MSSVEMVIGVVSGIGKLCSNSGLVYCVHFCTNAVGKIMNPFSVK